MVKAATPLQPAWTLVGIDVQPATWAATRGYGGASWDLRVESQRAGGPQHHVDLGRQHVFERANNVTKNLGSAIYSNAVVVDPASALTGFGLGCSATNTTLSGVGGLTNYPNLQDLYLNQSGVTNLSLAGCATSFPLPSYQPTHQQPNHHWSNRRGKLQIPTSKFQKNSRGNRKIKSKIMIMIKKMVASSCDD